MQVIRKGCVIYDVLVSSAQQQGKIGESLLGSMHHEYMGAMGGGNEL